MHTEKKRTLLSTQLLTLPLRIRTVALIAHLCMPLGMAWAWIEYFAQVHVGSISPAATIIALCGVSGVYSADRYFDLDPRLREYAYWVRPFLLCCAATASVCAAFFVGDLTVDHWYVCGFCILCSLANSMCKKVTYAKTLCVVCCWVCVCVLLPQAHFHFESLFDFRVVIWILLFAAACILCDIKDVGLDRLRSIQSVPVVHGENATRYCVQGLCCVLAIICVLYDFQILCILACCLMCIGMMKNFLRREIYAPLLIDTTLTACALLSCIL